VLYSSIVAELDRWALKQPNKVAFRYLLTGELSGPVHERTYRQLQAEMTQTAALLQRHCAAGERALMLYPPGPEFAYAFLGCLQAGVTAVPAYPPDPSTMERGLPRLMSIFKDCTPSVILTSAAVREFVAAAVSQIPDMKDTPVISTDGNGSNLDPSLSSETLAQRENELAFLQYTSGSTGTAKGVMVTHSNLDHNSRAIKQMAGHDTSAVVVTWTPVYHDMGLIGCFLQPIFCGGTVIQISPFAFLQKPKRWLDAISHFGGTSSGTPNFALDLCVRKVTKEQAAELDLSTWRMAFNGAEPVRAASLRAFSDHFKASGFRADTHHPVYGMAESTLLLTGEPTNRPIRTTCVDRSALEQGRVEPTSQDADGAIELVSVGRAIEDSD